jgi:hypothetical protein
MRLGRLVAAWGARRTARALIATAAALLRLDGRLRES